MGAETVGEDAGRGRPSAAYTGRAAGWNELAETLARLARSIQGEEGLELTLEAIVRAAADTVPGADEASISAVERRRTVRTLAATDELPRAVDQAQYDTGQGPCLSSLYEEHSVRLSDLITDRRWPAFAERARELGVGSMLSVQLYVRGDNLGALNMPSRRAGAFTDESEQVALLFAAHAAVAMAGARAQDNMRIAVSSRDVIGQAKGILIERFRISGDEAFRLLVVASQNTNIRLYDVADYLVRIGALAHRDG